MSELSVGTISGLAANSYVIDVASGSTLDLSAGAIFPAGNIVQVVSTSSGTVVTNNTTTLTDLLSLSITPSSATNKVFALVSGLILSTGGTAAYGAVSIDRNGTTIYNNNIVGQNEATTIVATVSMSYLDSPNTTSAVTYKYQMAKGTTTTSYTQTYQSYSLTLMEVAA